STRRLYATVLRDGSARDQHAIQSNDPTRRFRATWTASAPRHAPARRAAPTAHPVSSRRAQGPREAARDLARRERLAENLDDVELLRARAQRGADVSAHQHDRDVRADRADLLRELRAGHPGHRLVGKHEVETLRLRAEAVERLHARCEAH